MQQNKIDSFVLHSKPFKETSLLVQLFSKKHGRFSVIAKGIKRANSQALRAILQPFNLLSIDYVGRSELKTLTNAELLGESSRLPSRALACGYYMNELLLRSTQEWQEFANLYEYYSQALSALVDAKDYAPLLRNFEVKLLSELGIAPSWDTDIDGRPIESKRRYLFIVEQGFQTIVDHMEHSHSTNQSFFGEGILEFCEGEYSKQNSKVCQKITQMLLRQVIGDRPLQSRKLWI